ncbi:chloride channel protein [Pseudomonas putida]|jgi:H+/Cl- antiporter ClcA|uniref:Chloride channel protein n=1 Tax=Pseudomonas putida TaxID=303 RepID=A0A1X1A4F3_PSEPU|nr:MULTISPECIES: chloride channel protein [Pseudomonas]MCG3642646.1 chloride channel protein [Pseudomonas putida]MDD2014539.1 chloride channel protein [Pseudomonas putida]MDF3174092.1 chloride channel protein [Pseudomonas sp. ER28]MDH1929466.1 chloride channel protein [Pseudomonas sp. GD03696]MDX3744608.1 chloride channel protein [Pseudomonas sp.]
MPEPTRPAPSLSRRSSWREWRQRLAFWIGALLVGLVALAFAWLADAAFASFKRLLEWAPWSPLLITPLGFALLAYLTQRWFENAKGSGIPQVIAALEMPSRRLRARLLSLPVAAARMSLTLGALLVGGSVGREGPTVHIGAAVLYSFGRRLGLHGRRTIAGLVLAGGAAGIAAAFNTPLAGVVFAIEELSRTFEQRFSGLVLTAVLIGGVVTLGLMGHYAYFGEISGRMPVGWGWSVVPACAVLGGLLGGFYAKLVLPTDKGLLGRVCTLRGRYPVRFAAICGLLLATLGLVSGNHVFGTGYEETRALLEGQPITDTSFLLWKFLANVASYLSGIPGGLFSPSLSIGAAFAPLLSLLPDVDPQAGALLGMGAYLAGVTRSPLTASVIVLELTHSPDLAIPMLAATLMAAAISGWVSPVSLYHALAKQITDKLHAAASSSTEPAASQASATEKP